MYKEKGSKFTAFAYPISLAEEVRPLVDALREKYYDARHHCYAYRLGMGGVIFRAVDDGEPSGTAGRPILGALMSREVTNVLVVVVRYFGGTKLGTSGLITAYKEATIDALDKAQIVQRTLNRRVVMNFGYSQMNEVMRLVKATEMRVVDQKLENTCVMEIEIREAEAEQFIARAAKIEGVNLKI